MIQILIPAQNFDKKWRFHPLLKEWAFVSTLDFATSLICFEMLPPKVKILFISAFP
jgi:hypothetical protein